MFSIFRKKKIKLKELIPKGYVDIHSHILPGIDDGAKTINDSLKLISKMKDMGFGKIIGTPHTYPGLYENTSDSIKNSFLLLKKNVEPTFNISYSSEYFIDDYIISMAEKKSLLCLKDNYILVEIGFISIPNIFYEVIFQLQINGYKPILAHPERYSFLFNDMKEVYKLKNVGCMFQINLLSLTNYYGEDVKKFCEKLLIENLVDFTGSDIHSIRHINAFEGGVNRKISEKVKDATEKNKLFL